MSVQNAEIRLKKALQEWEKALDTITKLTRDNDEQTIYQMMQLERIKWNKLGAARHEYKEAVLESIGR
jgi:hypothetical protein